MPERYDPRYKRLAERLLRAREEAGLTQTDAATKLGLKQPDISKIESGDRRVDVVELLEFAELYGKEIGFFIEALR